MNKVNAVEDRIKQRKRQNKIPKQNKHFKTQKL
jgi:hypothetical protein